ncbi:MAG: RNA 2',3'-cyclic phosphodiesterase [Patescibacteria group bacterium]|nr:RNA 2',3'-cyclic phosphodiesterase [Patescibacteria group bacterium]
MVRLFIAIPLPHEIKLQINEIAEKLKKRLPNLGGARWVGEENWHLTVTFLGYQPEKEVPVIEKSIEALSRNSFRVDFDQVIFGPPGTTSRMIWLTTTKESSKIIDLLKKDLEEQLIKNGVRWQRETRPYLGHLTLVRFHEKSKINPDKVIEESLFGFKAVSLDLMRSELSRSGPVYTKISGIDYKG